MVRIGSPTRHASATSHLSDPAYSKVQAARVPRTRYGRRWPIVGGTFG